MKVWLENSHGGVYIHTMHPCCKGHASNDHLLAFILDERWPSVSSVPLGWDDVIEADLTIRKEGI